MPYITKDKRKICERAYYPLTKVISLLGVRGTLNYLLFRLAKHSCHSYSEYADFRSELIEAHDEIGRRLLAPYENTKIKINGDVE